MAGAGTGILGRAEELRTLRQLLEWNGAAQLLGPPGIGKTALARAMEPDGWVDLEGVKHLRMVQSRVGRAAGCEVDREEAALEAAGGLTLVVLDGAEELEPEAVRWLAVLAARVPVLITSRRRMDPELPALEVGPLSAEAGAALLRRRVGSARQGAALEEEALRALSQALDGVPLALELVAPRLRLRNAAELLQAPLSALLQGGPPGRRRLLEQVGQSLDGLSPEVREVLELACAIPGSFEAALLDAVAGRPADAELLELLDAGMLTPVAGIRPELKALEPVRAAVLDGLGQEGRERLLAALARAVLGSVEQAVHDLEGPISARPLRRLVDAVPLLERVCATRDPEIWHRAALALGAVERRAGPREATVGRDGQRPEGGPRELRVLWAVEVAAARAHLGQGTDGLDTLDRVREELVEAEIPTWMATRALCLSATGDVQGARALALEAVALADEPAVHFALGSVSFYAGDLDGAMEAFRRARAGGGRFRAVQATYALCICMRESWCAPELVLEEVDRAGVDPTDPDLAWLAPRFESVRAVLLADAGELERAVPLFEGSAERLRALGEPDDALALWLSAQALRLALGGDGQALREVPERQPGPGALPALKMQRAIAHALHGAVDAARALAGEALEVLVGRSDRRLGELGATWAVVLAAVDPEAAAAVVQRLPVEDPMVVLARRMLAGERVEAGARLEQRVMVALARRLGGGVRVARDGSWFVDGAGQEVDIRRRRVLRRVLGALAEATEPLDVGAICARAWPGEQLVGDSGTRRVHVAISTLRSLGLKEALCTVSRADGSTAWTLEAQRVGDS